MKKAFTIRRSPLESVMTLARIADLGSFRAAARELGVSVSAVSQIIRALEKRAEVPLLNRTTRTVALTEAGRRFLERARPATRELLSAFEAARAENNGISGLLRLNVPRSYGRHLIEPLLAEFTTLHPRVEVEVFAEDTPSNLIAEGFDAGVRLGEVIEKDMVAVRLTPAFRFVVVGAPGYFRRISRPMRSEDLAEHQCIRFRKRPRDAIQPWMFESHGRIVRLSVRGPLIVNDAGLALAAALSGIGLAYLPEPTVDSFLRSGQLQSVLDGAGVYTEGVYLYYPHRRQVVPRLRAFVEFVRRRNGTAVHKDRGE